jgi:murein DD-endopeptidase MepM/ murein hydrolase activator NlpD
MSSSSKTAPLRVRRWARHLLAASLVLVVASQPAHAQSGGPQYVVQPGDSLYAIAQRFGLTLESLQAANPGVDPAALAVGQALAVPGFEGVSGTLGTLVLEPGETLPSLSLRLGLARETLIRLNRVVNPDGLYMHQTMVVVDQLDGGPAIPNGTTHTAPAGAGLLALAASRNQNPWTLAAANRLPHPGLLPPGALIVAPGGDGATSALPFPLRSLRLRPLPPEQGRTVSIHIQTAQPVTLTGQLGEWPLHFNASAGDVHDALLGIFRLADPDLYRLSIAATDAAGRTVRFSQPLPVRGGDYGAEALNVNPATLDPVVTEPENEHIRSLTAAFTATRYWAGPFALPSVGAIRSWYGTLRAYNGGAYDSCHTGVDFSGAEDRLITAPAPGVVVFTGALTVRGNATLIDHGWGVYTGYWHQSQILVNVGDRVETGQLLGYQGATGRVTGPHLHWELWVGGYQADPMQWTTESLP